MSSPPSSDLRPSRHLNFTWIGAPFGIVSVLIYLLHTLFHPFSLTSHSPILNWKPTNASLNQTQTTEKPHCIHPIVALVTPDASHCEGASVLYGSIIRTVIAERLPHRSVCVNFMYIDASISLETMFRWEEQVNPFTNFTGCRELMNEQMKVVVPISWYAIAKLIPPHWSNQGAERWSTAMNKIHVWAFDRFERFFVLDVDILVLRELTKIIDETPLIYDIAAGIDGWSGCNDRSRLNGGALLIKGSRYLHSVALQMLDDPKASCESQGWALAEQELLNCLCGFLGEHPQRPEFKCALLPMYDHVFPRGYNCLDARVRPLRLIHFAGDTKPWHVQTNQTKERDLLFWWCLKDAMLKTVVDLMRCEPFSL